MTTKQGGWKNKRAVRASESGPKGTARAAAAAQVLIMNDAPEAHGNARSTAYMFILRAGEGEDPKDLPLPQFDSSKIQWLAYQLERGPQGGRVHIQGAIGLKKPARVTACASIMCMPFNRGQRTSFRVLHGTPQQAVAYCTSERYCNACHRGSGHRAPLPADCIACMCGGSSEKGVLEDFDAYFEGSLKHKMTHTQCVQAAQQGTCMGDLLQTQPDYVAGNIRFVSTVLSTICPPRCTPPVVTYLYGAAGSGKSRFAAGICSKSQTFFTWSSAWFDGMHANIMHLVLDDVRPERSIGPSFWLRLLDRYPFRVPVKGASVELVVPCITITSPLSPVDWWASVNNMHNTEEDPQQFVRRLTHVLHLPEDAHAQERVKQSMRTAMRAFCTSPPDNNDEEFNPRRDEVPPTVPTMFDRMQDI